MIKFRQKECSRQAVQHKKAISDPASACTQREDKEWKYQKKSVAGGMVCIYIGIQSSRQEWSSFECECSRSTLPLVGWLKCCFTSTETVGLLGTGAQDVHLDFHTAPDLSPVHLPLKHLTSPPPTTHAHTLSAHPSQLNYASSILQSSYFGQYWYVQYESNLPHWHTV